MRRNAGILTPALALLLIGIPLSESSGQSGRKGVEAAAKRMINAANKVNIDGVFAEIAPDAEMLDNGVRFATMDAVRAAYAPVFKALKKQDLKIERSNIQMTTPTLAVYTASGTFTSTDSTGKNSPRRGFAWTIVWREDQGKWKATSIHQSVAAPPAAPATVTQAGKPTSNDMKAFREFVAAYATAVNKRDAAAVAAMYATTADQVIRDRPRVAGRDAIRDAFRKDYAAWPASQRFSLEVTGARLIAPNVASVDTKASFTEGPVRSDRGTWVMVRDGDKWSISSLRVYPEAAKK